MGISLSTGAENCCTAGDLCVRRKCDAKYGGLVCCYKSPVSSLPCRIQTLLFYRYERSVSLGRCHYNQLCSFMARLLHAGFLIGNGGTDGAQPEIYTRT